jgi:hypothetical protein
VPVVNIGSRVFPENDDAAGLLISGAWLAIFQIRSADYLVSFARRQAPQ